MKKTFIILAAAALAAIVSCSKQKEEFNNTEEILTRVSVSLDNTKTSLSGTGSTRKVYWSNDDAININGNASNALTGIGSEESSAEFTFGVVLDTPYNVLYPASDYKSASTITLPSEQAAADGTFADGSMPMYAYSTTNAVASMSHLCGILEVNLTGSATIAFVQVTGGNSEQMSGDFTIDYQTGDLTATSTATADLKVKTLVDKTLSGTATPVYVVIPARTYSNGLTLRIVDEDGNYMDKTISGSRTVTAGHLAKLPSLAFASNGTLITTAAQWNAFAGEVNGGTSDASAEIGADIVLSGEYAVTGDFEGTVNGNGYTLSGITTPLFANVLAGGAINNLTVDGTLTTATSGEYFGILAKVNAGTISRCTAKGSITISGEVVEKLNIGGLVGQNTGTVFCAVSNVDISVSQAQSWTSEYISNIGGIVAENSGTVNGNTAYTTERCIYNATSMTIKDGHNTVNAGGIVGLNTGGKDSVNLLENYTPITLGVNYPAYLNLGGVVGSNTTVAKAVTNSWNYGAITVGGEDVTILLDLSKSGAHYIGGVIGNIAKDENGCTLVNAAPITTNYVFKGLALYGVGGVVGGAAANFSSNYAENLEAGKVEVIIWNNIAEFTSGCVHGVGGVIGYTTGNVQNLKNNATVYFHGNKLANAGKIARQWGIGGIAGYVSRKSATISGNRNYSTAEVRSWFPKFVNNRGIHTGGIVGRADITGETTVSGNVCSASVVSNVFGGGQGAINNKQTCGGIIGAAHANNDSAKITISGNTFDGANILHSGNDNNNSTWSVYYGSIAYCFITKGEVSVSDNTISDASTITFVRYKSNELVNTHTNKASVRPSYTGNFVSDDAAMENIDNLSTGTTDTIE